MNDEKERNGWVDKLIDVLTHSGTRLNNRDLAVHLQDEQCHNRHQTEDDYRKEQAEWLQAVADRKKRTK